MGHFNLGWQDKMKVIPKAREVLIAIRFLTEKELKLLFPRAIIHKERSFGLTKSFIVETW
jgi:hypothetical protein